MLAKRMALRRVAKVAPAVEPVLSHTPTRDLSHILFTPPVPTGPIPHNVYTMDSVGVLTLPDRSYRQFFYNATEKRTFIAIHYPKQLLQIYDRLNRHTQEELWGACVLYKYGGSHATKDGIIREANVGCDVMRQTILKIVRSSFQAVDEPDKHEKHEKPEKQDETTIAEVPEVENISMELLQPILSKPGVPTLVFAWTQTVTNRVKTANHGFWGLGDAMRGILAAYQFSKKNRCEFAIDPQRHPFFHFLTPSASNPVFRTLDRDIAVSFQGDDGGALDSLKLVLVPGTVTPIFCNMYPVEPLLSDEKRLIRDLLVIKPEYRLDLPPYGYSVLHVRVGDEGIDGVLPAKTLATYVNLVTKYLVDGDVICSDSVQLKRHVAATCPGIRVFVNDRRNGHVGYDTDPALLQNTLDDLQIVLGAKRVLTYSQYSWVSGFVDWGTKCFDIPLIDVKKM
jgi:hypothetical protein